MSDQQATAERPPGVAHGECWCGCGRQTNIAKKSDARRGHVRGERVRYVRGHVTSPGVRPPVREDRGHATPCLIWQGCVGTHGYGQVRDRGVVRRAHRVAYEREVGPIPDGMQLDHLCRVRACVNVEHLEPVTQTENVRRGGSVLLSWPAVRAIRSDPRPARLVAVEHGVSVHHVRNVRQRRSWWPDPSAATVPA